jgi:hypothetical protein
MYVWLYGDGMTSPAVLYSGKFRIYSKASTPGGRVGLAFSVDPEDNALYYFGGLLSTAYVTNTVFKFDLTSLKFAWVSGKLTPGSKGNYGPKNVSSEDYEPPALFSVSYFSEPSEKSFIFLEEFLFMLVQAHR